MAVFTNLYHAGEILRHIVLTQIAPANGVLVAPPPDTVTTNEEIRVSLLWINEQATHRSDAPHRNFDGTTASPPTSLSMFFLITAYGDGPGGNADAAHRLLGEVVRIFHTDPVVTLPLAGLAGNSGVGKLGVTLVPITPDLMEKLFSPLQIKHRPFALYEVSPVQLTSPLAPGAPSPVVAPGGIALAGPTTATRPVITRLVASTLAEGGALRIDGVFSGAVDAVLVGSTRILAAGVTVVAAGRSIRVALPTGAPGAVLPGVHRVSVVTGTLQSDPVELLVVQAGQWTLDGPAALTHAQWAPLVLTGQGLLDADLVYVWPDGGIRAPTDVRTFAPSLVAAGSITVLLSGLPRGEYRLAARLALGPGVAAQFTPYVVLEVGP